MINIMTKKILEKFGVFWKKIFQTNELLKNKKRLIAEQFKKELGYEINFDDPKSFNEKIQWIKLNYKNPLLTKCADKFVVREYVKEKIGNQYLVNLLAVYDKVEDIDFDNLPDKFVLKVNHGSGQNIICKNKNELNIQDAKEKLKIWMQPSSNHYYYSYEWCYKKIKPKIICEEYIEQLDGNLIDYKFLCFHGEPKYIWVDIDRFGNHRRNFYDLDWNYLEDFQLKYPKDRNTITSKPAHLKEMINIAKKLSEAFPHVRIDLYSLDDKIYFGEMTFYSGNGMEVFTPQKRDYELGNLITLPKK